MGKADFLTPKAIANRIKSKGLQKLRWYCQMCQKQCRDENGFKCHCMSESHQRQLLLASENPRQFMDYFSEEFRNEFLELLRRRFGTKRVHNNIVYNEYISHREHVHMNATQWETLTDFTKWLGREGVCKVDETPKGWYIQYIDRDPETIKRQQELEKKKKQDLDDEERTAKFIEEQVKRGKSEKDEETPVYTELNRENEEEKVTFNLAKGTSTSGPSSSKSSSTSMANALKSTAVPGPVKRKDPTPSQIKEKKKKSALDEIIELHHLLPRLVLENKEGLLEELEDSPVLGCSVLAPSVDWKEAAIGLWRQSRFQQLLTEETFQLSFRDWLLWEMNLDSDQDPLRDTERQEYQRWALNCCFFPTSSAKGGCGNDAEIACSTMVDAVLEFSCRSEPRAGSRPGHSRTGMADILCRLQELVCDLLAPSRSGHLSRMTFLFDVFHRRLEVSSGGKKMSTQLRKQGEVAMCSRILLGLPSTFLVSTSPESGDSGLDCEDFFTFINKELKNLGPWGCALPYDITAHFFRGLLGASTRCEDPSDAVNAILRAAQSRCPIILTSAALWWPQLDPVMECQWRRLLGGNLPEEMETLREAQSEADRCLSHHTSLPLTPHPPWLSAAVLHFTIKREKMGHGAVLQILGRQAVQVLDCLLFFSVMDLIPVILKEGERLKKGLENCLSMIGCLEESGGSWVTVFQPRKEKYMTLLHQTASDAFSDLLPLAFFSLAPCLLMERAVVQQDFVRLTLEIYGRFVQLFVDGNPLLDQVDTNEIFSNGRQFLLKSIAKCPPPNSVFRSHLPQMADSWEEKDPEIAACLRNLLHPPHDDDDMFDEPDIF